MKEILFQASFRKQVAVAFGLLAFCPQYTIETRNYDHRTYNSVNDQKTG
jgi:hypothetical protein